MTPGRLLPLLNLAGCLLVTGILLAQWHKERGHVARIETLTQQLVTSREQFDVENKRALALGQDITQLKDAIESTSRSRQEAENALTQLRADRQAQTATASSSHEAQAKIWEQAIAERDAKIRALDASLTDTRARLDEAIAKLKAAGAR